jgi:hypothetical protein
MVESSAGNRAKLYDRIAVIMSAVYKGSNEAGFSMMFSPLNRAV